MQHVDSAGGIEHMEVDHFDPRKKKDYLQNYDNLFLAKRACNLKKRDNWPTPAEQAAGVRFINCCEEPDYGEHIFEDPKTHEVWGATPAGIYQIRICGLNSVNLVAERKNRYEQRQRILKGFAKVKPSIAFDVGGRALLKHLISKVKVSLDKMIPDIPLRVKPAAALKRTAAP